MISDLYASSPPTTFNRTSNRFIFVHPSYAIRRHHHHTSPPLLSPLFASHLGLSISSKSSDFINRPLFYFSRNELYSAVSSAPWTVCALLLLPPFIHQNQSTHKIPPDAYLRFVCRFHIFLIPYIHTRFGVGIRRN